VKLHVALFYHSLVSDWNHGNAHFLRGIASELLAQGHNVSIYEPAICWSRDNLIAQHGPTAELGFQLAFPRLRSHVYHSFDQVPALLDGVDLALVHEWNEPGLISAIGCYRREDSRLRVFFHDTHHRAITAPHEMERFDLSEYDGVLAYGASLKAAYQRLGWGKRVHVWHEAADTRTFHPCESESRDGDVVWIGNWGDEERTAELREYLIDPIKRANLTARVHGVRYPQTAIDDLASAGIEYCGWIPNYKVPKVFARFAATVHVPRRPYTEQLAGIPTIRVFEALACGIPLVSAPWRDDEHLFRVGEDFLMVRSGAEMEHSLNAVINDQGLREALSSSGLETIRKRHTCAHRVRELLTIYEAIAPATQFTEVTA
jgi:spore maturation protein CgeB